MSEYYLISQLPSLDGVGEHSPMPITVEQFDSLCESCLGKRPSAMLRELTLLPPLKPEQDSSAFIEAWNSHERALRLALAQVRAEKMGKSFHLDVALPAELIRISHTAADMENPMEAELFLTEHRLAFLETLRPLDTFKTDYIFYYALRLKLLSRIRQFDTSRGESAYRKIYDSVFSGERLDVSQ